MNSSELAYFLGREAQEWLAAEVAQSPAAEIAHRDLAQCYADRVAQLVARAAARNPGGPVLRIVASRDARAPQLLISAAD